jgi:hypothetical protein
MRSRLAGFEAAGFGSAGFEESVVWLPDYPE